MSFVNPPAVTAILGPTNTGKTYLAVERLIAHGTGMMGFPLRLLARENYDRVVGIKGKASVALITGEEKIIPPNPRYFICTVEAMPLDKRVDFLAVDEIQLCADPDRGHVFTDRLLHARGARETMFLGSETIKPLIRKLVPDAEIETRPRFSQLTYIGPKKLTRLPPRTAVVAFSASEVYAMAETIRRHRGGAAVVMGALSPRTRNAQVALYQSGEVDYLVATDAIGMGLNMDVNHVCFAATRKFDGHRLRPLDAPEVAQIAGRAGRHMKDGTFGASTEVGAMSPGLVEQVEAHEFQRLRGIYWRNRDLDFSTPKDLIGSLSISPNETGLARTPDSDDLKILQILSRDDEVLAKASDRRGVKLLWEVCQIPDFGQVMPENHARMLASIYLHLRGGNQRLPTDWVAVQVDRLDRMDGDIEALTGRIAGVRTWTYIAYRSDWLVDAVHWQTRTRQIEDRLSDALHDRLTQRFIDRRTAALVSKLENRDKMVAAVAKTGEVLLEGHLVGHMRGLKFVADETEDSTAAKAVASAAGQALSSEVAARVKTIEGAENTAFTLADDGNIVWDKAPIAKLVAGPDVLRPDVQVLANDLLEGEAKERVRKRLADWLVALITEDLAPLVKARDAELPSSTRGLVFQMIEALGQLPRAPVEKLIKDMSEDDRKALTMLGIRFGVETLYMPHLLKPAQQRLKSILWAAAKGDARPEMPVAGRVSFPPVDGVPPEFYEVLGYRVLGGLVVRVDMLERFAAEIRHLTKDKPAELPHDLLSVLGIGVEAAKPLISALGYKTEDAAEQVEGKPKVVNISRIRTPKRPPNKARPDGKGKGKRPQAAKPKPEKKEKPMDPDSPFAVLKNLKMK